MCTTENSHIILNFKTNETLNLAHGWSQGYDKDSNLSSKFNDVQILEK